MIKPSTPEAFKLMMEGSQALTDVEEHGMRIDVGYLDKIIEETGEELKQIKEELKQDDIYNHFRRRFSVNADVTNRNQLSDVLFKDLGYEAKSFSEKSKDEEGNYKPKTDEDAFAHIDLPFLKKWTWMQKLEKCRTTYLIGIRRQTVDGYLHPSFNLHIARTFRSSSSNPNFQNFMNRIRALAKLIRQAFVPREGHIILEIDYGALEFRGAACFWKDPSMIDYASNPDLDIHRDTAMDCYLLNREEVSKPARSYAKNQFVFPVLYGSYWKNCGPALYEAINRANLQTVSGTSLYDHLESKGIFNAEDYTNHVKKVEENFNKRFSHWANEKQKWWEQYLRRGWFSLMTGFVCSGIYSFNNLMNYPIQGSCFHLLLWSLIELNKWLKKHKMKSMIVGQIHDSIVMDVHKKEIQDVINQAEHIMTKAVRDYWDWVVTPLIIEVEGSGVNWFEKEPIEKQNGKWRPVAD